MNKVQSVHHAKVVWLYLTQNLAVV